MKSELLPGTGGVVRFPAERRARPTLALAEELAPRQDLADAMADEWANGESRPDTLLQAAEAFTMLAEALEFSMGVEAALAQLRAMNAVQVERACALGWAYRDAEAASEAAAAESSRTPRARASAGCSTGGTRRCGAAARCGRQQRWPRGRRPTRRGVPRRRSTATRAASRGGAGRATTTACS